MVGLAQGWGHRGYGRDKGSRLGPQGGGAAGRVWPDTTATLPSHPLPSLGGSNPPTDPARWGFQMLIVVVSREASNLGTLDPIIDPRDPLHSHITHHFQTDPQRPHHPLTHKRPQRTSLLPDLQGDSRGPTALTCKQTPSGFPLPP